ncbi:hypothetical protein [Luteolibacter soli]|uniref:DUF3592 domain-containing protein n=1 Tax=Luteolibacter soli TaxID=3135280 RepID=A0ABU9AY56_9BACT
MSKPTPHSVTFWAGIIVLVSLAALAVDSFFFSTNFRIPRSGTNPPAFAYLEGGVIHLDWETTPAPYTERTFKFLRTRIQDSPSPVSSDHLLPKYQKSNTYKYEGATPADRKAAQAAGIRTPKIKYTLSLPIWMIITLTVILWFFLYKKRARRLAKEEWELAQKEAAAS